MQNSRSKFTSAAVETSEWLADDDDSVAAAAAGGGLLALCLVRCRSGSAHQQNTRQENLLLPTSTQFIFIKLLGYAMLYVGVSITIVAVMSMTMGGQRR